MKNIILLVCICLFVALAGGTTFYLYRKEQKPPITYQLDSSFVATIYKKTLTTGAIEPRKEVFIKPQISGILQKLYKKAGDQVKAGETIAIIKIVPNMQRINDAETSLKTTTINFDIAKAEFNRQKALYDDKVISQFDFIKFEQDFKLKQEQLEAAKNNLQLVMKGSSRRISNSNTIVKATIEGMLLDIPVKEGGMLIESNNFNEGTTIATIANMNDIVFKGKVVESEVGKLKVGLPLLLEIGAIANEKYMATLEFISSKGIDDKGTIKFEVKAGLKNFGTKYQIRSGYSASADIILDQRDSVLAIREKNIEFTKDSAFVYLQKSGQDFVKIPVKLGLSDDINIEVLSGLKVGDKIKVLDNKK